MFTNTPSPATTSTTAYHLIPVEIVSEEEMAFIEAALFSSRAILSSSSSPRSSILPPSTPPLAAASMKTRPVHSTASLSDIEDAGGIQRRKSLFHLYRKRGVLSVTDLTATEWCEKQMEFALVHGKPKRTEAMKAGSERHMELEEEVITSVSIPVKSHEDKWAVKFLNFIDGANQLLSEGITRELLVVGVLEGIWVIGVIDEICLPMTGSLINPLLVDTKTRSRATLPSEAQKRNARFQLMCYKFLWDNIVDNNFSIDQFFKHFDLNPKQILFEDVKNFGAALGFQHKTLEDVVNQFRDICTLLPQSEDQLLLRYELQGDRTELGEFKFAYDAGWFRGEVQKSLKFWFGEREADYVAQDEQWKCNFCKFVDRCPCVLKHPNNVK